MLAIQGRSQHEIARTLGITQPAVSQILRRVDERWLRENQDRVARHKVERTGSWTTCIGKRCTRGSRARTNARTGGNAGPTESATGGSGAVAEVIVDDSHGDPRYLETARRALADSAKI